MKNKTEIKKSLSKRKYTGGWWSYFANFESDKKGNSSYDKSTLFGKISFDKTGLLKILYFGLLPLRATYLLNRRFVEKNGLEIKNKNDLVNKNESNELETKTANYVYLILFKKDDDNEIQKCDTTNDKKTIQSSDVCKNIDENVYFPVTSVTTGDSNFISFKINEKGIYNRSHFQYKNKHWLWGVEILGNTLKVTYDVEGNLNMIETTDNDGNLMPIEKIVRFSSRYFNSKRKEDIEEGNLKNTKYFEKIGGGKTVSKKTRKTRKTRKE
jgi:hypothetical protein